VHHVPGIRRPARGTVSSPAWLRPRPSIAG